MLNKLFERAQEVGQRKPPVMNRQRLAERAEELSRAGTLQAQLDVCTAAMVALTNVLYAVDGDGRPVNIDEGTGRIMIPVPWGNSGWKRWGLRKWEAELLRRFLIDQWGDRRDTLFAYDGETRQWYIDHELYRSKEEALAYIKHHGPTLAQWRVIAEAYRTREGVRLGRYQR